MAKAEEKTTCEVKLKKLSDLIYGNLDIWKVLEDGNGNLALEFGKIDDWQERIQRRGIVRP